MTTARLETFADGVFAIAATLLILNVEVPELGEHSLSHELAASLARVRRLRRQLRDDRDHLGEPPHRPATCCAAPTGPSCSSTSSSCSASRSFRSRRGCSRRTSAPTTAAPPPSLYGITLTATAVFFNLMWRYAIGGGGRLLRADADRRDRRRDHAQLPAGRADVCRRDDRGNLPGGGERRPLRCDRVVLRALQLGVRPRGGRDVTIDTRVEIREIAGAGRPLAPARARRDLAGRLAVADRRDPAAPRRRATAFASSAAFADGRARRVRLRLPRRQRAVVARPCRARTRRGGNRTLARARSFRVHRAARAGGLSPARHRRAPARRAPRGDRRIRPPCSRRRPTTSRRSRSTQAAAGA